MAIKAAALRESPLIKAARAHVAGGAMAQAALLLGVPVFGAGDASFSSDGMRMSFSMSPLEAETLAGQAALIAQLPGGVEAGQLPLPGLKLSDNRQDRDSVLPITLLALAGGRWPGG